MDSYYKTRFHAFFTHLVSTLHIQSQTNDSQLEAYLAQNTPTLVRLCQQKQMLLMTSSVSIIILISVFCIQIAWMGVLEGLIITTLIMLHFFTIQFLLHLPSFTLPHKFFTMATITQIVSLTVMQYGNTSIIIYCVALTPTFIVHIFTKDCIVFFAVQLIINVYLQTTCLERVFQFLFLLHTLFSALQATHTLTLSSSLILGLQRDMINNTNYVAGIVHDLRNPISAIFSCFELIQALVPPEKMSHELGDIITSCKKAADNMVVMISNIMDYAKLQSRKLELNLQAINVKELLHNIIDLHTAKAK